MSSPASVDASAGPVDPQRGATVTPSGRVGTSVAERVVPWLLVGAFVAQLAILVRRHEPWFDEAQAWLVARDTGFVELFTERLRYEGSPALWHVILMVPAKMGLPYAAMSWIAAGFAVLGAVLIARPAPFPLWGRAGLLFSYVVAYQYAAVARSYSLMPLLLFGVALAWPRRMDRVGRFAGLLALLACISLHGTLVAGGIAAWHVLGVLRRWFRLDTATRFRQVIAMTALLVLAGAIAWTLWPPADLDNGGAAPLRLELAALLLVPRFLDLALTGHVIATLPAVLLTGYFLWRSRSLGLWIFAGLGVLLLSALKYHMPHHEGVPFLAWVFALWVGLDRPLSAYRGSLRAARIARALGLAGLAIVLAVQVGWWLRTYRHDYARPYSGSPAVAAYLAGLPADATVYLTAWHGLGVAPYFTDNPFANYNGGALPAYWTWTFDAPLRGTWEDVQRDQPDVVVWGIKFDWQQQLPVWEGYEQVHRYDGEIFAKTAVVGVDSFVIYERVGFGEDSGSQAGGA